MAFVDQVQDLTSLTASDTDELSQFLKDGVLDVTNRWLAVRPQDIELFARESSEQTSNGSLHLNGAKIISIIREDGTNNQWRNCRKISSALQYDVTDVDSLNYASKINPAYMVGNNGQISVFPSPGLDPDSFKVYYVNNDPEDKGGANLIHSHSDIGYFPDDKVYLVVMYAGMRLIQAEIGELSNLSITTVPPDTPSLSSTSISFSTSAPVYTAPVVGGSIEEMTASMDADSAGYGTEADFLNFSKWFSVAGEFIEDEEDSELAASQLQKINSYIGTYQAAMQNKLNEFNDANAEYQAQLKIAIQNAQLDSQDDAQKLQKFQNEIAAYQADVGAQVQEHGASMQGLQAQYALLRRDYDSAFGIAAPKQQPQGR